MFKEKITTDEVKEKAFEELYSQLDSYKRNFVDSAMKPFVQDLLLFYDRITSDIEHCKVSDNASQSDSMLTFKDELSNSTLTFATLVFASINGSM